LSLIRPRKSIFDTYVTLLHYCFPYSLRASDTPNTTPSNLVYLIWHHPLLTHGLPPLHRKPLLALSLHSPSLRCGPARLLAAQERSALLNARDIDNGALNPSEAKCQHGPSIKLSFGPGPSLKFPLFPTRRTRHLSFLIRRSHHGNARLPPMVQTKHETFILTGS